MFSTTISALKAYVMNTNESNSHVADTAFRKLSRSLYEVVRLLLVYSSFLILTFACVVIILWLCNVIEFDLHSEELRNATIVLGSPIALLIALWRSHTANKQQKADASGRLYDRYQKGVEMIGSQESVVRMGGITILERLSKEHTKEFHVQVVNLLEKLVKQSRESQHAVITTVDIQEALMVMGRRNKQEILSYKNDLDSLVDFSHSNLDKVIIRNSNFVGTKFNSSNWRHAQIYDSSFTITHFESVHFEKAFFRNVRFSQPVLHHAFFAKAIFVDVVMEDANAYSAKFDHTDLHKGKFIKMDASRAAFRDANLERSDFTCAILNNATFDRANLMEIELRDACMKQVKLREANLQNANLSGVNLLGADLSDADLSGTNFTGAINLTQEQLDAACQSPGDAPILDKGLMWKKDAALERFRKLEAKRKRFPKSDS